MCSTLIPGDAELWCASSNQQRDLPEAVSQSGANVESNVTKCDTSTENTAWIRGLCPDAPQISCAVSSWADLVCSIVRASDCDSVPRVHCDQD